MGSRRRSAARRAAVAIRWYFSRAGTGTLGTMSDFILKMRRGGNWFLKPTEYFAWHRNDSGQRGGPRKSAILSIGYLGKGQRSAPSPCAFMLDGPEPDLALAH